MENDISFYVFASFEAFKDTEAPEIYMCHRHPISLQDWENCIERNPLNIHRPKHEWNQSEDMFI